MTFSRSFIFKTPPNADFVYALPRKNAAILIPQNFSLTFQRPGSALGEAAAQAISANKQVVRESPAGMALRRAAQWQILDIVEIKSE